MVSGQLSALNRYKNSSDEEKEKVRIRMAENYYRKTEGKVKRRTPYKLPHGHKSRRNILDVN